MMNLREKLIRMFYKVATSNRKIRNLLTPVGASFFFTFVILFIIAALWLDKLLRLPKLFPASLNLLVSMPILAIGLLLILWSNLHFIKVKGTPVPFNPPPSLVATGPYAYVRNPMISGVFILLFGLGILFNSIALLFIFTPFFILINILELKGVEEPELEKRLGKEYLEYKKKGNSSAP